MKQIFRLLLVSFLLISIGSEVLYAAPPKKKGKKNIVLSKGSLYDLVSKSKSSYFFTKKYSKETKDIYKTTYNIYNQRKEIINIVVARHNKKTHTVEVILKDITPNGFPILNIESTHYESPFLGRFGNVGKVGAIGKAKALNTTPSQLMLCFANKRYDFVKVISIANAHEDSGKDLQVFELDMD